MDARRELQGDADAPALRQCFERVQGGKFPGRLRRNVRAICRRHAGIAGRFRSRLQDHTVRSQSDDEWLRFLLWLPEKKTEERRVGKECVRKCRARCTACNKKTKNTN